MQPGPQTIRYTHSSVPLETNSYVYYNKKGDNIIMSFWLKKMIFLSTKEGYFVIQGTFQIGGGEGEEWPSFLLITNATPS